ncbi:hypothetical protein D3C72_2572530 [compost metagenome]
MKQQEAATADLAITIVPRETGRASKSLKVRSVYSRPNVQLTTAPKPMIPNTLLNIKTTFRR